MRNVILLREWRDDQHRDAKASVVKIAIRSARRRADVPRQQVDWRDPIRIYGRWRRNMIIKTTRFVVRKNECRIFPRGAGHQSIDQACSVGSSSLHVVAGMLI